MSGVEEIGALAISLSLEAQSFDKQMSTIQKTINRAEREFKNAGKGVEGFENSFQGLDKKINKTEKQITLYNTKLEKQQEEHKRLNEVFNKSKKALDELEETTGKGSKEWELQAKEVQKNADKLATLTTKIGTTESEIKKLSNELTKAKSDFEELGNKTQSLDEKLEDISRDADLAKSEFNKLGTELNQSGTYFQKLGNEMDTLSSDISSGINKIKAYEGEILSLSTTIDKNKQDHAQLSQEINKIEQDLSKAKSEYGESSTEVLQLNQKLLVLKDSYNTLEGEINQNESELKEYRTELNNTQAEVSQLSNELLRMPFDRIGSDLASAGNSLKSVGQSMTTGVTLPLVAVGATATKVGIDFDRAMSEVQAISGATGEDFTKLKTMAEDMGKSTKFSASQAAEAMTYMGMAGWKTNDMLSGLPGILNLAAAGGTDLAIASDIVTDGLTGLGLTANDSSKFVDIMAATITNANTNVEMMGETLKYAGPVAGSLGISMEDLSLAIGLMGNAGIKASQAGTALRGGLTNLVKPTDKMESAMEQYGISVQKTSDGSVDFMATIKLLREKLGGLDETTQAATLATIFGKEAMSGWASIVNASEADFNKLNSAISNSTGKAEELAKTMQENLGGSIDNMKSALEGALKDGFEAMLPVLEKVVEVITDVAKWFSNLDEEAQKNIMVMAGVAAAIGPILMAVGQLLIVGGNAVTLFGKISTTGGTTAKTLGLLKTGFKLLGGPMGIGAAILALTLACKAFKEIDKQMQKDTIKSINDVIDGMAELSEETKKTITPFLELSQTVESEFMKMNSSGVIMTSDMKTSVLKNLDEMTSGVSESITTAKDEAVNGLNQMFESTVSITEEEKELIISKTKESYDGKIETISTSKDKINEILNTALSENRELNIEEENLITSHYKNIKDISLESMVSNKDELLAIKQELNINSKELSAQQASDVIQEATKQRDETISAANAEYEERLRYAEILRTEGGAENEALANKVIEEAKRMKNDQIQYANQAADGVISSARVQAGEYVKNIDYMTGEVRNRWEQLSFDLGNVAIDMYYNMIESFQDLGANTQIVFNGMKLSVLEFVLDCIEWWRELPFTKDDAFTDIYNKCKESIDSTTNYLNDKKQEIDNLSLFRELPGKVKNELDILKPVLEEHFKVPIEQLLTDTEIWSNMTAEQFYKLPPEIQEALRGIDQALVETGNGSFESFLQRTRMNNEGVIYSFNQLDTDTQASMTNLNNNLLNLNGVNLDQFVLQCISAADGGKTAFESLPEGVQASIQSLNSILIDRHGITLEQFILNTKIATGEYTETIDTTTKDAADKADKNTKELANKVDTNTKDSKDKADKNTKDLKDSIDKNTKNATSDADKNTKDLSNKVDINTKDANKKAKDNMDNAAKDVKDATSKMATDAKKNTGDVAKNTDDDFKKANKSVQQSATDMYNGAKKSYSELAKSGKQSLTDLYNDGKKSVEALTRSVKQGATDAYNGSSTSFKKIPTVVSDSIKSAVDKAKSYISSFKSAGLNSGQAWIDGFNSKKSAMRTAVASVPKPKTRISTLNPFKLFKKESIDNKEFNDMPVTSYSTYSSNSKSSSFQTKDEIKLIEEKNKKLKEIENKRLKDIEEHNKKAKEIETKRQKEIAQAKSNNDLKKAMQSTFSNTNVKTKAIEKAIQDLNFTNKYLSIKTPDIPTGAIFSTQKHVIDASKYQLSGSYFSSKSLSGNDLNKTVDSNETNALLKQLISSIETLDKGNNSKEIIQVILNEKVLVEAVAEPLDRKLGKSKKVKTITKGGGNIVT